MSISGGLVGRAVKPIEGRNASTDGLSPQAQPGGGIFSNLPSLLEYREWDSGEPGTLILSTQLSVGELYERISSAQGLVSRSSSQALLLILFVIGGLFVLIEVMALGTGLALARSITGSVHELFTGTERVRRGDFTHKIAVTAQDQLGELAQSFNSMTASIEDLLREAAEKKRLENSIAREIRCRCCRRAAPHARSLGDRALRAGAGSGRRLLRSDRREHRLGDGLPTCRARDVGGALHGRIEGLMLSLSQIHTSPRVLPLRTV